MAVGGGEKMKRIASGFLLTMFLLCGIIGAQASTPRLAYAADNNLGSVIDDINNSTSVLGGETKKKVAGISKDVQEIVLIIVIAALMVSGSLTAVKFANVGDNPSEKAKLKTTLIFIIGGIVFLASFFGLMKFGFSNFNLF